MRHDTTVSRNLRLTLSHIAIFEARYGQKCGFYRRIIRIAPKDGSTRVGRHTKLLREPICVVSELRFNKRAR